MVKFKSIRLYLPDAKLKERVGTDAAPLSVYVNALLQEANAFWARLARPAAKGLLVAVGVKPSGRARVWCDPVDGDVVADSLNNFCTALERVPPLPVQNGPIAFAMELGLWEQMPAEFPVLPQSWKDAAKNAGRPLSVPDGLFAAMWKQ